MVQIFFKYRAQYNYPSKFSIIRGFRGIVEGKGNMNRDIEKDLIEIECAIKSQKEKDNIFTMSVLQRCYKLVSQLKEYKDLEEQGKLLKLPAAIGDEIFFIFMDCPKDYKEEYCRDHDGSCENCHHRVPEIVSKDFQMSDISNMDKIFATREEAEAALKEMSE